MNNLLKNKLVLGFGAVIVVMLGVIIFLLAGGNKSDNQATSSSAVSSATNSGSSSESYDPAKAAESLAKVTITPNDVVNSKDGVILYAVDETVDSWDDQAFIEGLTYFKDGKMTDYDWSTYAGYNGEGPQMKVSDVLKMSDKQVLAKAKQLTKEALVAREKSLPTDYDDGYTTNKNATAALKNFKANYGKTFNVEIEGLYNNVTDSSYYEEDINKKSGESFLRFGMTFSYPSLDGQQFKGWMRDNEYGATRYVVRSKSKKAFYTGFDQRHAKGIKDTHEVRDDD